MPTTAVTPPSTDEVAALLTRLQGPGGSPAAASDGAGYVMGDGSQHVVFRGTDNQIHELWWLGQWCHNNLSVDSGNAPPAAGTPSGYMLGNTQHVVYRGSDSKIYELWWDGKWHYNNLSVAAGNAPIAAGDPCGYILFDTQHVVYRGADSKIYELWWDGQWHYNNLTVAAANAPVAAGDPFGYVLFNNQHVVFRGADKKIHELCWDGTWHYNNLSVAAGNAPLAASDPCGYVLFNTQHVVYLGTDNQIHELWWDGQWHHNNLNVAAGNAPVAAGVPFGYTLFNTEHVVYRGTDSKIHELWWDGQWHHNNLNVAAGNADLAAGDPCGYIRYDTQHVIYRGTDSKMHELWWDGQWHHNNLSVDAGLRALNVELIPQKTSMWCWAASAEMIMKYEGHDVSQCSQANHEFSRTDCCNSPTPPVCVNGGWPEFNIWNFNCSETKSGTALTFAQLQAQIDANTPVWFSWWWTGGGGHAMVVRGYSIDTDSVYINDPWAPNVGDVRWVSYADYVAHANNHTHAVDFYNIRFKTAGASPAGAYEERPTMTQESLPKAPTGYQDADSAAREALRMFSSLVTAGNAREMGFDKVPDPASLSLGQRLPIFYIRQDALKAFSAGNDVRKLLVDGEEFLYPVIMDGQTVSSVVVAKQEGAWRFRSLGSHNLVKVLVAIRGRQAGVSGNEASSYFIVSIPGMNQMFIGHYDTETKLMLTAVHDSVEFGVAGSGMQPAEEMMLAMVPLAKEERHGIPKRR
jgi:hypothetical protein